MAHGSKSISVVAPRSRLYQGPFGRLFSDLPPWQPESKLSADELEEVLANFVSTHMTGTDGSEQFTGNPTIDPADSNVPAAYTYFGQFVDHDITFDPASDLMRRNDPNGLVNHRTPRMDLDSVYGGGPGGTPFLYQKEARFKFLTDTIEAELNGTMLSLPDLPRNDEGRALIGDPRNDENAIVAQTHLAFLLAHNTLFERAVDMGKTDEEAYEQARNTLRWLYQYIVWNDFIARITDPVIHAAALKKVEETGLPTRWELGLKHVYNWKHQPFMPIEFSVAAYRFGHTMARNRYQTNFPLNGFGFSATVPLFHRDGDDLRGETALNPRNYMQWDWFLQMESSQADLGFPQMTRKLDPLLSEALTTLPEFARDGAPFNVLAFRNLLRSFSFDLPSGTSVAQMLGFEPIPLANNTEDQLWFYILKEAELQGGGNRLGQVGSAIICATFAGLLQGDPASYFSMNPSWTPDSDDLLREEDKRDSDPDWQLASIIRLAGLPVAGTDFAEFAKDDEDDEAMNAPA